MESADQKYERELLEKNADRVGNLIKNTGTIGSSKKPQLIPKDKELLVTFDQLGDKGGGEGRPVIPIAIEPNGAGGWDYILTPADYHYVKEGKVCAKCLQWQDSSIMTPTCRWLGKTRGCGHEKILSVDLNYTGAKI
jgi:hypothetical protein